MYLKLKMIVLVFAVVIGLVGYVGAADSNGSAYDNITFNVTDPSPSLNLIMVGDGQSANLSETGFPLNIVLVLLSLVPLMYFGKRRNMK